MPDLSFLPHVNAALNAVATVLLVWGLMLIRRRRVATHRNVMILAFGVSSLFLVFYVLHKAWRAASGFDINSTFNAEGPVKALYLLILLTHVVLAAAVPVFAIALIVLGLKRRDHWHRRLARVAWPVWMYVSITGVVIYVMLYHLNPAP